MSKSSCWAHEAPMDDIRVDAILKTLRFLRSAQVHPPVGRERRRTGPLLLPLLQHIQHLGLPFDEYSEGPWWVGCEHLVSPHRSGDLVIPTVTRGGAYRLRVDEVETALQLAGYLSWRMVPEP
jgi:hypothetical protein